MITKSKVVYITIITIISLFMGLISLDAAWWEARAIPVPPNAEKVKEEDRRISSSDLTFTYYTSSQAPASIKDFYRQRLPNLGWKERELIKGIEQIPGIKDVSSLKTALENNLMFEKDSDWIVITFTPANFFKDGKTRFSVCQGKLDFNAESPPDTNLVPELLTKPKKNVAPVYPGASLITLSEKPNSLKATYFSQDEIESVASFYKTQMPAQGWFLREETPLKKINPGDYSQYNIQEPCPSCAEKGAALIKSMEMLFKELVFYNERADSCKIGLSRLSSTKELEEKFNLTTIMVQYEEKQK